MCGLVWIVRRVLAEAARSGVEQRGGARSRRRTARARRLKGQPDGLRWLNPAALGPFPGGGGLGIAAWEYIRTWGTSHRFCLSAAAADGSGAGRAGQDVLV